VLAVELQPRGDRAEGLLVLPFGLAIDKGVSIKIGEAEIGPALRFKTCLPQGCIVPLSFDAKAMALLRKGTVLSLGALGDGDQPVPFSISLGGFVPAFDRAATLAK
jgi:invasion protein IalB